MIYLGDLVKAKDSEDASVGLVFHVEHAFYGKHSGRMNRLHILWQNGVRTEEPEAYVELFSSGDWI